MTIKNYDDVEGALGILAELTAQKAKREAELTMRINNLKEIAKEDLKLDLASAKSIEKAIKTFCDDNKQDFATSRTKKFNVGEIGYRVVKTVSIPRAKDKVEKMIDTLNALKLHHCVNIEETINKEEIKELDDTQLAKLGLVKVTKDSFRIQPNIEKIA